MIRCAFAEIEAATNTKTACIALGVARATHYRRLAPARPCRAPRPRPKPAWTLPEAVRKRVLDVLHSPRFVDSSPGQVWAILLDDGEWLCSLRSMYRILADAGENRERRRQATHPPRVKPHLVARHPDAVWVWDISALPGPARNQHYRLYQILDLYSRKTIHWQVEHRENGDLAVAMLDKAIAANGGVVPAGLVLHSDRGSPMTSDAFKQRCVELGITISYSRPKVSNDNPHIEASFKTLKYCPAYPGSFDSLADTRTWCAAYFHHYNNVHRHSSLGWHTPASIHDGTAYRIRERRQAVLDTAYQANPIQFRNRPPQAPRIPEIAWINPDDEIQTR